MGKVVALSSYECNRVSERENRDEQQTCEVLLFTGVRYERMGARGQSASINDEDAQLNIRLPANTSP